MKTKNNTNSDSKSSQVNATPWPNLPQRILKYIGKHPSALEGINFGLATKSWECLRPQCRQNSDQLARPRLLVSDPLSSATTPQYFGLKCPYYKYLGCLYYQSWYRSPLYVWARFLGCSHGLVFSSAAENSTPAIALNVFYPRPHGLRIVWPDIPFVSAALSSGFDRYGPDGRSRCILMVITGLSSPAFMFKNLENTEWINKDCDISEPVPRRRGRKNGKDFMRFSNTIGFKGKFYALSSQGTLAVIEETEPDRFNIATLGKGRAIPPVPVRSFRECLLESDGEILVVFLVHITSSRVVDGVEVYRLNLEDLSWVRMESLGEQRTLFVGDDCCVSVCAEKVGCRGDRVYFAQRNGVAADWWEFDMKCGVMSQTEWAVGSGKRNALEWDKPALSEEEVKPV